MMTSLPEVTEQQTDENFLHPVQGLNAAALEFVRKPKLLLIGGNWVGSHSGKTLEVIDPTTGLSLTTVALAQAEDVDLAVKAARKAFEAATWANITAHQRGLYLLKIADLIEQHAEELATIQTLEMGMLFEFAKQLTLGMVDVFRYYAGWPTKILGDTFPTDGSSLSYTIREPLGVVGSIIPWNGPVLATAWKVAPALACGNTVVMKPAEVAPLTSLRMAELMQEAGLPDGVINMVPGLGQGAGSALVAHPDVNKISFTGSTAVGKQILTESAGNLKKVTLELGGKSPNIIFQDADLTKAIPAALMGFVAGSGQGCVCTTRIFIQASIYDEVAAGVSQAAQNLKMGSPFDASTQLGPLTSQQQLDRVTGYIAFGKAEGAELKSGGNRRGDKGFFVEPTVFTKVRDGMRIFQEEIFGPVSMLVPFKDEADAVLRANDTRYGLAASVWTKDLARAHRVARSLQAGIVWVNTIFELDAMAPFGGYKESGLGRELGPDSIDNFTQTKTVVMRF